MSKSRADKLLVAHGLFESRARAQAAIEAGLVSADGIVVKKASDMVADVAAIVASAVHPYVSRGGIKLAAALDAFGLDAGGRTCLDVGASTGGFTDVLLRRGAACVIAVDTGRDQLHPSLKGHPAIISLEGVDVRALAPSALIHIPDLAVVDVSFISLKLVLPPLSRLLAAKADLIALIKPQFEVGRGHIGKKGLVKDEAARLEAVASVEATARELGWMVRGTMVSPITGGDGNIEYLLVATRG